MGSITTCHTTILSVISSWLPTCSFHYSIRCRAGSLWEWSKQPRHNLFTWQGRLSVTLFTSFRLPALAGRRLGPHSSEEHSLHWSLVFFLYRILLLCAEEWESRDAAGGKFRGAARYIVWVPTIEMLLTRFSWIIFTLANSAENTLRRGETGREEEKKGANYKGNIGVRLQMLHFYFICCPGFHIESRLLWHPIIRIN